MYVFGRVSVATQGTTKLLQPRSSSSIKTDRGVAAMLVLHSTLQRICVLCDREGIFGISATRLSTKAVDLLLCCACWKSPLPHQPVVGQILSCKIWKGTCSVVCLPTAKVILVGRCITPRLHQRFFRVRATCLEIKRHLESLDRMVGFWPRPDSHKVPLDSYTPIL